jgi:hypothetical protein
MGLNLWSKMFMSEALVHIKYSRADYDHVCFLPFGKLGAQTHLENRMFREGTHPTGDTSKIRALLT